MSSFVDQTVIEHLQLMKSKVTERHFEDKIIELIKPDDETANKSITICDSKETTVSYLPEEIDVFQIESDLQTKADEFSEVFGDCAPSEAEENLFDYVMSKIDPVGWLAVWVSSKLILPDGSEKRDDNCHLYLVQVKQVSSKNYNTDVIVYSNQNEALNSFEKSFMGYQEIHEANLLELWPLKKQPDYIVEITPTHNVLELLRLYYKYIWRPYDNEETMGNYMNDQVYLRIDILQDAATKSISQSMFNNMTQLIRQSFDTEMKIQALEDEYEVTNPEKEITELEACRLSILHEKKAIIKDGLESLETPALRQLAFSCLLSENSSPTAHVIMKKAPIKDVRALLDDIEMKTDAEMDVHFYKTFTDVIPNIFTNDFIFLCPGMHDVTSLYKLEQGGHMLGLSQIADHVIIEPTISGDILLCCESASFMQLHNIMIKGSNKCSIILFIRDSNVEIMNCKFVGAKCALKICGSSSVKISSSKIEKCEKAINLMDEATLEMKDCIIQECNIGLEVSEKSNGKLNSVQLINNDTGINVLTTQLELTTPSKDKSLTKLCPNLKTMDLQLTGNVSDMTTVPLLSV